MAADLALRWGVPAGFLTYALSTVTEGWVQEVVDDVCEGEDAQARDVFAGDLAAALGWAHQQENEPEAWHALVVRQEDGPPRVAGVGWVEFRPLLDIDELARGWQEQIDAEGARGDVAVVPSKRAPFAVLRQVTLEQDDEGSERYVERGRLVKSFPRLGVTGVLTVMTSDLAAFADMTDFLRGSAAGFVVEADGDA